MTTHSRAARFAQALDRMSGGLEQVEQAMRGQLGSPESLIETLADHILSAGGKRVRPALLFLAAELCGYTGPRCVQIAAAVELLHNATLLHDDVVDLALVRRGRTAANALWGNRRAVLVGDFLYARASSMVVEDGDLDILWVFANTIQRMAEGEILQLQRSFDPEITEAQYYQVIERKSATLMSAACEAGAILGGVTRAECRRVAEYGTQLGIAFQLRDDSLDYAADEAELGKRRYTDLREGKVTLPLLLTLKRASASEREMIVSTLKSAARIADALGAGDGADLESLDAEPVVDLVRQYRGVEDTVRRAGDHAARAVAAIAPFADGLARQALVGAADFVAERPS